MCTLPMGNMFPWRGTCFVTIFSGLSRIGAIKVCVILILIVNPCLSNTFTVSGSESLQDI